MAKKTGSLPLNTLSDTSEDGIVIARALGGDIQMDSVGLAHRDDYHIFLLLERGKLAFEIDFERYELEAPSAMYVRPYQVHRGLAVEDAKFVMLLMSGENLAAECLAVMDTIPNVAPLALSPGDFSQMADMAGLCLEFQDRGRDRIYFSLLRNGCNSLAALIASQYLARSGALDVPLRFQAIYKTFSQILEAHYGTMKRPSEYARALHVSTAYLNECLKRATGFAVSHHIRGRILLEAKRLLYHTDKSIKEIARELGYEDPYYFSRSFAQANGMSASAFRRKNRD